MEWLERWTYKKFEEYKKNPGMWFADVVYYVLLSAFLAAMCSVGIVLGLMYTAHKMTSLF